MITPAVMAIAAVIGGEVLRLALTCRIGGLANEQMVTFSEIDLQ